MSDTDRIEGFLHRCSPSVESLLRTSRDQLRSRFDRGHELVFDNHNALVFAFSATASSARAFLSVAGYPRWVNLFFGDGVALDDPAGLLRGTGRTMRSIRVTSAEVLEQAEVRALVDQAIARHTDELAQAPPLTVVIKTQGGPRPRRP